MRPKTLFLLALGLVLLYTAATPLGLLSIDIGGLFTNLGNFLLKIGISFHHGQG